MIRSFLATAPRIIAFTLVLDLLAAIGFAGMVPARHQHRRVSTAHKRAAERPVKATARTPVHRAVLVASRTPVRVTTVRAQKEEAAGPRPVAPAPAIIAGGPWTSPTFADSTDGGNIDGEDLDMRRAAGGSPGECKRAGGGGVGVQ